MGDFYDLWIQWLIWKVVFVFFKIFLMVYVLLAYGHLVSSSDPYAMDDNDDTEMIDLV